MRYKGKILIVDDDEGILISLRLLLARQFESVRTERNPNHIPALLAYERFDIYLLDMNFSAGISSGNEGIFWLNKILELDPAAMVILMTAHGNIKLAVKAIKEGASDFILKPWENEHLVNVLRNAYRLRVSNQEIHRLKQKQVHLIQQAEQGYDFIAGPSESMRKVVDTINRVAKTEANVLILGEHGTGKEMVAREIHRKSWRASEVFISVDMGAISDTLFESELFGHVKGAYTGAIDDRAGRFVIASGGTLFLDEIGNLALPMQSKILAVLQDRELTPLGSNEAIPIDVRLISASNCHLHARVEDHCFREDLLYRINTIEVHLPPLRERREDILLLANHFLKRFIIKYKRGERQWHPRASKRLLDYHWPGNVRELEHFVEKAVIMSEREYITLDDTSFQMHQDNGLESASSLNLEENEKLLIRKALKRHKGNMTAAAKELGVSRKTLYNKVSRYRI